MGVLQGDACGLEGPGYFAVGPEGACGHDWLLLLGTSARRPYIGGAGLRSGVWAAVAVFLAGGAAAVRVSTLYSNNVRFPSQAFLTYLYALLSYSRFREALVDSQKELLMIVREAIQESGLPKAVIAQDAHISRSTLDSWIAGVRMPRGNSLKHLAAGLRARAARLVELAEKLDRAA